MEGRSGSLFAGDVNVAAKAPGDSQRTCQAEPMPFTFQDSTFVDLGIPFEYQIVVFWIYPRAVVRHIDAQKSVVIGHVDIELFFFGDEARF